MVTRALPDGHLMYVLFVTPEQDASRYGSVLNNIVASLDVNDSSRSH